MGLSQPGAALGKRAAPSKPAGAILALGIAGISPGRRRVSTSRKCNKAFP